MPRGTQHVLTGILRRGRWGYALQMDGGGMWQLDVTGSADRHLNTRVTVEGRRSGYDLIDVYRLYPADAPPPPPPEPWGVRLRRFFRGH